MTTARPSTLTDTELAEIDRANASGRRPVLFVHGLWLLSSSWDRWRTFFEENGYTGLAPRWPDDPESVAEARRDPEVFAKKMVQQVTDHYLEAVARLERRPAVIGHSFGGLIALKLAGEGVAAATVAIDNAPFQGVLSVPLSSLKSAAPVVGNPAILSRAVSLTYEQFAFGWVNALDEAEGRALYEEFHVPASGVPLFQAVTANLNPFSETKVDSGNPDRGPLLIIGGEKDTTVPLAISRESHRRQSRNRGVTELVELPDRGHSLTIDHGWQEVAQTALSFLRRQAV
ncbi:Pimeloyl-ACP methyl ester carboxylesterase [Rathayibacter oskolensis]|uniref:Pimeloyl-ACP methyl ester carboxylesterase n=1 Tax=Rathayibacter oskolensis TaxID=1891671 RepID=A0A1X7PA04_9MICO|nr:alpha/beta hydrolase [Rathayibacter oskolensis]SMH46950.1 Pimeloyl-ACP methyl ester carboxylesterase [Rathayibacter oskolensis]